jgi:hypothetical protein
LYNFNCVAVLAIAFKRLSLRKVYSKIKTFVASLIDIIKALQTKIRTDLCTKLLKQYYKFLDVFSCKQFNKLLLLCNKGIDYRIKLKKQDKKDPKVL